MRLHRYNWRPDRPDFRDLKFSDLDEVDKKPRLTNKVDLRVKCSPVVNQLQIGSCTGNAIAGGQEYLQLLQLRDRLPLSEATQVFTLGKFEPVSRLFVYYNERFIEGTTEQDAGAEIRTGMKAIAKWGICREATWEYKDENALSKPSDVAYDEAKEHIASKYYRINEGDVNAMKSCLVHGYPFVFGFSVYSSFESLEVSKTGIMPMPSLDESLLGGHAVLAVGFDEATQRFLVRNSWGEDWGEKGHFWMPYAYIGNTDLATDFWTMRASKV